MYIRLLNCSSIFQLLLKIDLELLDKSHKKPCGHCGAPLDRADYQRKPRGHIEHSDRFNTRFSLCCRQEGCRKRVCPPSIRFFRRRVWSGPVFMIGSILAGDHSQKALINFSNELGIDIKTIGRWRRWWNDYAFSREWQHLKGLFHLPVDESRLPSSLLSICIHQSDITKKIIWLLRLFTNPLF